jgi:hypothetical protein
MEYKVKILPKNSPGRAAKPAVRQRVERGQIVGYGAVSHTRRNRKSETNKL